MEAHYGPFRSSIGFVWVCDGFTRAKAAADGGCDHHFKCTAKHVEHFFETVEEVRWSPGNTCRTKKNQIKFLFCWVPV